MAISQPKESPLVFIISRTFNAPRNRIWKAWTEADQSKQWFGPKGCKVTYNRFDIKPGGDARYSIEFNGAKMSGKWSYKEVKAPEKLVAIVAFTDESGDKIVPHPGMPGWPKEMHSVINFIDKGNKTEIVVQWEPFNPTKAESETFAKNHASMQQGWGGSFDQLEAFLAK